MIAAMGPKYQKFIWWKKYLTSFQMVQFVAIFIHQFQLLFRECDYPPYFMWWIGFHGVMFLFLFSDFYKAKYYAAKAKARLNGHSNGKANGISNGKSNGKGTLNGNGNGNVSYCKSFKFFLFVKN